MGLIVSAGDGNVDTFMCEIWNVNLDDIITYSKTVTVHYHSTYTYCNIVHINTGRRPVVWTPQTCTITDAAGAAAATCVIIESFEPHRFAESTHTHTFDNHHITAANTSTLPPVRQCSS